MPDAIIKATVKQELRTPSKILQNAMPKEQKCALAFCSPAFHVVEWGQIVYSIRQSSIGARRFVTTRTYPRNLMSDRSIQNSDCSLIRSNFYLSLARSLKIRLGFGNRSLTHE
jgi:hypothetical protein